MARSSNRRKKQLFPFGYLMIPVVGFLGVGLLFFSVKLFFISDSDDSSVAYVRQEDISSKEKPLITLEEEPLDVPNGEMVAVPVIKTGNNTIPSSPSSSKPSPKPQASPTQGHVKAPSAKPAPIPTGTAWMVQIGSFKQKSMADSLMSEVKGRGFKATVGHGDVDGVRYYRVLLPGGNSRAEAQSLGERLSSMGYPYFVFPRK